MFWVLITLAVIGVVLFWITRPHSRKSAMRVQGPRQGPSEQSKRDRAERARTPMHEWRVKGVVWGTDEPTEITVRARLRKDAIRTAGRDGVKAQELTDLGEA